MLDDDWDLKSLSIVAELQRISIEMFFYFLIVFLKIFLYAELSLWIIFNAAKRFVYKLLNSLSDKSHSVVGVVDAVVTSGRKSGCIERVIGECRTRNGGN